MLTSLLYVVCGRAMALVLLCSRSSEYKELEIVVQSTVHWPSGVRSLGRRGRRDDGGVHVSPAVDSTCTSIYSIAVDSRLRSVGPTRGP